MATPYWDNSPNGAGGITPGPGTSGPDSAPNEWDTVLFGSARAPGICTVRIPTKPRRLQNKKQNGGDGATPTFRGLDPAKVEITVTIWTPAQLAAWDALLPLIFPNPNKDVNRLSAIDISHPATHQRGIKSVIIEDLDGPNDGSVKGAKTYNLKCTEYLPQTKKAAVKTVVGAVATTAAFHRAPSGKNAPPPPSSSDFGPTPAAVPQGGSS